MHSCALSKINDQFIHGESQYRRIKKIKSSFYLSGIPISPMKASLVKFGFLMNWLTGRANAPIDVDYIDVGRWWENKGSYVRQFLFRTACDFRVPPLVNFQHLKDWTVSRDWSGLGIVFNLYSHYQKMFGVLLFFVLLANNFKATQFIYIMS